MKKNKIKSELLALNEIQIFKPKFTKPFKKVNAQYGLHLDKDERGLYFIKIDKLSEDLSSENSPIIHLSTSKSAEKVKKRIMNSGAFSKIKSKRNKLSKEKDLSVKAVEAFNKDFKNRFTEYYSVSFKDGYMIYEFIDSSIGKGLKIKDFYLDSWGTISLGTNNSVEFSPDFEFVQKQKLTRSFKAITSKVSSREVVIKP